MRHFSMLKTWLATPAVKQWWGDPTEQADILLEDIRDSRMAMTMNIVTLEDHPFAFIQDYEVHAWPQKHLAQLPSGSRAIDTFIGLESHLGQGHGSGYLRQRATQLLEHGAAKVVIDPELANSRARRAYQKAGFEVISIEQTSQGQLALMEFVAG